MIDKVLAVLIAIALSLSVARDMVGPIALDKNNRTRLYVLDSNGNIFVRENTKFQFFAAIPFGSRPVDIVSANFENQEYVFVCSAILGQQQSAQQQAPSGPAGYGLITEFNATGIVVKQWRLPDLCGGFDITKDHIIYFAGAREPVIFSFSANDPSPKFQTVGYIKGARTLGPLIFDDLRTRIYTADLASGNLFKLDPKNGEAGPLSTAFTEPQALALSPDRLELYIADTSKGTIWRLPLSSPSAQPVLFSNASFRRPSGLAPGINGHLWVADSGNN
jgi:hypothetical protein